jgi:hypothetical protein
MSVLRKTYIESDRTKFGSQPRVSSSAQTEKKEKKSGAMYQAGATLRFLGSASAERAIILGGATLRFLASASAGNHMAFICGVITFFARVLESCLRYELTDSL